MIKDRIITLIGSTRFEDTFIKVSQKLTLDGYLVLMPTIFTKVDKELGDVEFDEIMLLQLGYQRIAMSDHILVIDVNNYVGESTRAEIIFADYLQKPISYYSKTKDKIQGI